MKILGIDYGRKKIGLAISVSRIAEPLMVIRVESPEEATDIIRKVIKVEEIEKVVIGISEGKMGEESKNFSLSLACRQAGLSKKIPIEMFDETLSTYEAQRLSVEAGVKKLKRKKLEDAFAATVMLQSYLEEKINV